MNPSSSLLVQIVEFSYYVFAAVALIAMAVAVIKHIWEKL